VEPIHLIDLNHPLVKLAGVVDWGHSMPPPELFDGQSDRDAADGRTALS
jgi:hypothetical protein